MTTTAKTTTSSAKPARVATEHITIAQCPVCLEGIEGTLTVEVHLGTPKITTSSQDEHTGAIGIRAVAAAHTRLRALDLAHRCNPQDVADRYAADQTAVEGQS